MPIELERELRDTAVASIQRYFDQNMEEPIGNIAAGALLGFFLEEIAPVIYNRAVADVQERLQARVAELDLKSTRKNSPTGASMTRPSAAGDRMPCAGVDPVPGRRCLEPRGTQVLRGFLCPRARDGRVPQMSNSIAAPAPRRTDAARPGYGISLIPESLPNLDNPLSLLVISIKNVPFLLARGHSGKSGRARRKGTQCQAAHADGLAGATQNMARGMVRVQRLRQPVRGRS